MSLLKHKKPLLEKLREEQPQDNPVLAEMKAALEQGDGINSPPMPVSEPGLGGALKPLYASHEVRVTAGSDDPAGTRLQEDAPAIAKKRGRPKKEPSVISEAPQPLTEAEIAYGRDVVAPRIAAQVAAGIDPVLEPKKETASEIVREFPDAGLILQVVNTPAHTKPIQTLYIGCLPLNEPDLTYAHDLIAKAAETVCADTELHHVKLADFGKGGALLAAQLKADLLEEPVKNLFFDPKSTEGWDVKQTLLGLAEHVVMGV